MNKNPILYRIATFISYLFSPVTLLPGIYVIYILNRELGESQLLFSFLILFGVGILPIILTLAFFKHKKLISDWDVRERKERYLLNIVILIFASIALLIFYLFGQQAIFRISLVLLVWFLLFSLITFFWKISAHTGVATLFALLLGITFGNVSWWSIGIIVLVGWSRVYRKNHTLLQVIGGVLLSWLVVSLANAYNPL